MILWWPLIAFSRRALKDITHKSNLSLGKKHFSLYIFNIKCLALKYSRALCTTGDLPQYKRNYNKKAALLCLTIHYHNNAVCFSKHHHFPGWNYWTRGKAPLMGWSSLFGLVTLVTVLTRLLELPLFFVSGVPRAAVWQHGSVPAEYLYNWVHTCLSLAEIASKKAPSLAPFGIQF